MKRKIDKKEMLRLRLQGRTYKYIAEKAGVTRQCVQHSLVPPKEVRDFIVGKYDGYCASCGLYVGKSGHVHHEPANNGEDYNDRDNLVLLCVSCHREKHKDTFFFPEKVSRNNRLYRYHLAHPDMTYEALAGTFHLKSRQHVFTIIKRLKQNSIK